MTRAGWAVAALALIAALVGWRAGWAELAVPGTAAGAMIIVALLLTIGSSTYRVRVQLPQRRVPVGGRATGAVSVTNASRYRLLPAYVMLPVGSGVAQFRLPSLASGETFEEIFVIPTNRRAVLQVGPVRSMRGDPIGLVRRELSWSEPQELFVHPETVQLSGPAAGVLRDLEGRATSVISDSDMSFHALRDYVAGDDRRHVHWKTSARVGTLMVRQFEETRQTRTAVALATRRSQYRSAGEFELAVSVAASLAIATIRQQREIAVLAGNAITRPGAPAGMLTVATPPRFLDDCSRLVTSDDGPGSADLVPWVQRRVPDASTVFFVVGAGQDMAQLRADFARVPAGVSAVVITCALHQAPEFKRVGTVSFVSVGDLAQLAPSLRQVTL